MTRWRDTLTITVLSVICFGQSIPPEQAIRAKRWDATHGTLFFGLGALDRTSRPIRSYQGDFQTTAEVEILKDFPRAQKAFVIDATAGPESSTILSVVLDFGSEVLRHVILTYDSAGYCVRFWTQLPSQPLRSLQMRTGTCSRWEINSWVKRPTINHTRFFAHMMQGDLSSDNSSIRAASMRDAGQSDPAMAGTLYIRCSHCMTGNSIFTPLWKTNF